MHEYKQLLCVSRSPGYGAFNPQDVFVWIGAMAAERYEQEERFARDSKIWDSEPRKGIRKWNKYKENGEALFLTIKGQIDPTLWDRTMDNAQFAAVETLKCPIALINLMKNRCTGAVTGLWGPLALLKQFLSTTNIYQRPKGGQAMLIGDYKRTVESNVATTCQMAGKCTFWTVLMRQAFPGCKRDYPGTIYCMYWHLQINYHTIASMRTL